MPPWLQIAAGALLATSLWLGYRGVRWVQRYARLTRTDVVDAREVRAPGTVALSGTVTAESPFASPLSGRECVLLRWKVEEWSETGRTKGWRTVATGTFAKPFAVDDGTGAVTVDPRERAADGSVGTTWPEFLEGGAHLDPDVVDFLGDVKPRTNREPETVSGRLKRFERATGVGPSAGASGLFPLLDFGRQHGERRYSEWVLGPDETVFVLGDAVVDGGADRPYHPDDLTLRPAGRRTYDVLPFPRAVSVRTPTTEELLLSEHPAPETTARVRRMTLLVPWALVLAGLAAATLAATRGLVPIDPSTPLLAGVVALAFGAAYGWSW
jgi:hypothetical protein